MDLRETVRMRDGFVTCDVNIFMVWKFVIRRQEERNADGSLFRILPCVDVDRRFGNMYRLFFFLVFSAPWFKEVEYCECRCKNYGCWPPRRTGPVAWTWLGADRTAVLASYLCGGVLFGAAQTVVFPANYISGCRSLVKLRLLFTQLINNILSLTSDVYNAIC